jgi:hypothetical protein
VVAWSVIGVVAAIVGLVIFSVPALLRTGVVSVTVSAGDLAIILVLVVVLAAVHEGIQALAMRMFGGQPRFGFSRVAGVMPALYTTAPGHRFSRIEYLVVIFAPAVSISASGFAMCFSPSAGYLVFPLAAHLAACAGDFGFGLRTLREPRGTVCEDLSGGTRFYRPTPRSPS